MDSRDNAKYLTALQAAGFCDDFVGCQGGGEGIYLSGNEQAPAADSRKSAQKPTPKHRKLNRLKN
ncbi:hypothetical protein [Helicobacter canis]|uniref:Uncharacterized protein n=1 Tax=Helicobacter canis NCTC 12740 TaxID=1357399 RepID=V8CKX6_9HELI|nr:hypothetical protein [Helicobacter canis]ETD27752.1 hypothetical protein HMPREF2087_00673 [Helicobacter canis NCTC 12740]